MRTYAFKLLLVCAILCGAIRDTCADDIATVNKPSANLLVSIIRFRKILFDEFVSSNYSASRRAILEKYHEELALPAMRELANLAIRNKEQESIREILHFVVQCDASADEEVANVGAAVFVKLPEQVERELSAFNIRSFEIVLKALKLGVANLGDAQAESKLDKIKNRRVTGK